MVTLFISPPRCGNKNSRRDFKTIWQRDCLSGTYGGQHLSEEALLQQVDSYLQENDLEGKVDVAFNENALAPAAMGGAHGSTLIIGWPIRQREHRFWGVLNHEIGTHCLRRLNDRQQCWHKSKRKRKDKKKNEDATDCVPDSHSPPAFRHCLRTEEGLACINTIVNQDCKLLWRPALHYYAVCRGAQLSFADLYGDLARYIDDPARRWEQCVRVKRGFEDTAQIGAFTKDQVYLEGAWRILSEFRDLKFQLLYAGRISLDDLPRAAGFADLQVVHMPAFLHDTVDYRANLAEIATENFVDEVTINRYDHWICAARCPSDKGVEIDDDMEDDLTVDEAF